MAATDGAHVLLSLPWFPTYDRDETFVTERTIRIHVVHIWTIKMYFLHIFGLFITIFLISANHVAVFLLLYWKQTSDDFLPRCQILYSSYAKHYLMNDDEQGNLVSLRPLKATFPAACNKTLPQDN